MGLDTSHNAWHGSYSSFHRWRTWLAEQIGIPLEIMEGFYSEKDINPHMFTLLDYQYPKGDELEMSAIRRFRKQLPLKWSAFKPSALHVLLHHSDCDGYINYSDCRRIAKELNKILSKIETDQPNSRSTDFRRADYDGNYNATVRFMTGCELAAKNKEKLIFS